MEIMNHREMEYESNKLFKAHNISLENGNYWFEATDTKAKELMNWLNDNQNKVTIEDIELDYGLDCLRGYLMFEKLPKENDIDMDTWEECSLEGVYKFLCKYYRAMHIIYEANNEGYYYDINTSMLETSVDKAFFECNKFLQLENTMPNRHNIYSCLMDTLKTISKECKINELIVKKHDDEIAHANANAGEIKLVENTSLVNEKLIDICKKYMTLVSPFVPYITEQCWKLFDSSSLAIEQKWLYTTVVEETIELPVQVNGKTRNVIVIEKYMAKDDIEKLAYESICKYVTTDYKCIYVPGKIINFIEVR